MSDFKVLEDKINHVDKTVTGIDTTIKYLAEKLAETVKQNSVATANHNNRISELERSFHVYEGSIRALNRLLALCGAGILSGVVWLFIQIADMKREYALADSNYRHITTELNEIKQELADVKHKSVEKSSQF